MSAILKASSKRPNPFAEEQSFYSQYGWCVNPVLSVRSLLGRLIDEIRSYTVRDILWQRSETRSNIYLFAAAIACTTDDFLAIRTVDLKPLAVRVPQARRGLQILQRAADFAVAGAHLLSGREVLRWRHSWNECLDLACGLLLDGESSSTTEQARTLQSKVVELGQWNLPAALLDFRMRLPEAFRAQDMGDADVIRLLQSIPPESSPAGEDLTIVGLRSAGAYFAPLMAAWLRNNGHHRLSWLSIRPKNGVSPHERKVLEKLARNKSRVLLVDDYPSTGHTFRLAFEIFREFGIERDNVTVLAPTHPAQTKWAELAGLDKEPRVSNGTIYFADLHKTHCIESGALAPVVSDFYEALGWQDICLLETAETCAINSKLAGHYDAGHHVRLKHVFAVQGRNALGKIETWKLIAKSAGWGWLGYHAWIAGTRLQRFVPQVIGLRHGLLISEWIEPNDRHPDADERTIRHLAGYVAARTRTLRLEHDPHLHSTGYRWTGHDELLSVLRAAFGSYTGLLKQPALHRHLNAIDCPVPTMLDGRIMPSEWIQTADKPCKLDFEHHNFGGGELDLVDPAFDLAGIAIEFDLDFNSERSLLNSYMADSGDTGIQSRLLLNKILYGRRVFRYAAKDARSLAGSAAEAANRRYQAARTHLTFAMNRFCAGLLPAEPHAWTSKLFFMDLDGVYDRETFGFAHTTPDGLRALALLRARGYSVVLNTGRSIEHVRHYCSTYALCGGIAEYGSVFVDACGQRELPLIDPQAAGQLDECRETIRTMPGLFMDPSYTFSIRAYHYEGDRTAGLSSAEIDELWHRHPFDRLKVIRRAEDTYLVSANTGKGRAMQTVRNQLRCAALPAAAMGDSEHDVDMLRAAEYPFAPANCAPLLRQLSAQGYCTISSRPFQSGLLQAAERLTGKNAAEAKVTLSPPQQLDSLDRILHMLLHVVDRPRSRQLLAILQPNRL